MSIPILATKLYIPQPRTKAVLRPSLIGRLNEGLDRKLTLISASAGFGKTTLVSEWVAVCERPVSWLSLDEGDNDPARFLTYLITAVQTIADGIGEGALGALKSSQPPPTESILTILVNEISTIPYKFVLVLDDYHVIDAKQIDDALIFLLENLPQQMHLIIATRENPQFPLARLRVRDQLTELRATDLRFTPGEAAAFLNQVMGLVLSADEITALETRTEGWIAGLQLAALSMQGCEDIPAFIRAFAGDNRYIVDYLAEEVLQRQPEHVRSFLLQTAILDRLHGPLCDAVTGQEDGNARLDALERGNFFVVPLDDRRQWYRYHHLFAEVLSTHLREDQPDQVATLHRRASTWYEQHGSAADAIRHALASEDFARAADLIEMACPAMRSSRQEAAVLGWLKALPDELFRCRPVLSAGYAWALLASGEFEAAMDRLRDAERWLGTTEDMSERTETPVVEMIVMDEEEFRRLPGAISLYRAAYAQALGDVSATMKYARQVLDLVPEGDHLLRGSAAALLGLASWTSGDLEAAHRSFTDGMAIVQLAGGISDAIGGAIAPADIRIAQGRLRQAMRTYERGLQLATEQGEPALRGTADMYVGMSQLYREHDDLHVATQHLLRSKEQGEHTGFPQNRYRWHVAMARIREAQGDLDGALDMLHEAEHLYVSDFFPNIRPVAALRTRVWVAQGRLDEALDWAREHGLSAGDDLCYLREFEHITLARVLLLRYKSDRADRSMLEVMGLLERLLQAAEEGERTGSVIEILVVQALAHHMQGDIPAALTPLKRALALAEPEGYVRIFVDEGRPMAALLEAAVKQGIAMNYVRRLLTAFGKVEGRTLAKQVMSEPLSERERDVLRLLRTDLSGPDIARQLMVSLNTLRTHTKNIYDKLEVNNRRAAVRRAEELDLF
ncbi:LuxR C-terminal-related transcriptional regulator [Paenibacillus prosopidis]|uniref:LuxR family maltose regulon positive regulatory protein n=1 Tax=Paenibacillus prosopidis TaxID=630520 RepID=A0A368W5W7_9BACL|nr:LuxR C-terminal-related transcriptional regulator [Paenibacillus prosopidis]RCW48387.1 LuxR family maltose regulon positive regulatory protein [Paenibacillus prosopidis]